MDYPQALRAASDKAIETDQWVAVHDNNDGTYTVEVHDEVPTLSEIVNSNIVAWVPGR